MGEKFVSYGHLAGVHAFGWRKKPMEKSGWSWLVIHARL